MVPENTSKVRRYGMLAGNNPFFGTETWAQQCHTWYHNNPQDHISKSRHLERGSLGVDHCVTDRRICIRCLQKMYRKTHKLTDTMGRGHQKTLTVNFTVTAQPTQAH